jgi:hypothetical protein
VTPSAPPTAPRIHPGFLPLATASGQIALPGSQTMPRTEVGGPTVSLGSQTTPRIEASGLTRGWRSDRQTTLGTMVGGLTATPKGQTA